jgi:XTP/dITP diphosphohydrolase
MKYFQLFTTNVNKVKEYKQYANALGVSVDVVMNPTPIPELQSEHPEDVLKSKAEHIQRITKLPFIVEDTTFITSRYKNFPGSNAKFINQTLGREGWERLFQEGDPISAITLIHLSYFGKTYVFKGRLDGVISFAYEGPEQKGAQINSLFFIPSEQAFLADMIAKDQFENHRKKAMKEMLRFVERCEHEEARSFADTTSRWDRRARTWKSEVKNKDSYVHHENGFQRFSSVIEKFLPVIQGKALDIGCGDGAVSIQLAEKDDLHVVGIDGSLEMIRKARKAEKPNLSFVQTTFEDFAPTEAFDCIVSRGILISHLPFTGVFDYLKEVTNLARPNAYFIFDFLQNEQSGDFPSKHPLNAFTLETLSDVMRELGWICVYAEGAETNRIRTVAFHKCAEDTVYFATGNPLKVQELTHALGRSAKQLHFFGMNIDEIKSDDLEKIVTDKLLKSYAIAKRPVICTDGGIFIEALNGFPGENSKQAAKKLGAKGLLALLGKESNRKAVRRNCMGYYDGSMKKLFTAEIACEISPKARERYHAYEMDKILIPISDKNPNKLTYAEMPVEARVGFTELPQLAAFIKTLRKK